MAQATQLTPLHFLDHFLAAGSVYVGDAISGERLEW